MSHHALRCSADHESLSPRAILNRIPSGIPSSRRDRISNRDRLSNRDRGFTLVELLIVIAIIAMLAAMAMGGATVARQKAARAQAVADIGTFVNGLQMYFTDYNVFPGAGDPAEEETNSFPILYENLLGEKSDKGGMNAPYVEGVPFDRTVVADGEDEEGNTEWRQATKSERLDPDEEKFLQDPWLNVYRYRENKSKRKREEYMITRNKYDLWSPGRDGVDEAIYGEVEGEDCDDIGNWGG